MEIIGKEKANRRAKAIFVLFASSGILMLLWNLWIVQKLGVGQEVWNYWIFLVIRMAWNYITSTSDKVNAGDIGIGAEFNKWFYLIGGYLIVAAGLWYFA